MDYDFKAILKGIPGYDPCRGADAFYFDEDEATFRMDFFYEHLELIEGGTAHQPFILQPWQQAIVANLFGWKHKKTGHRRYRQAFIEVSRKNGKSPLAAGIVLSMAFCDNEPGAQIYSAAGEKDQAAIVYRHVAGMIGANEELAKRSRIYRSFKSIDFKDSSFYRALSAEAKTKHGYNAHGVVVDELHIFSDSELVDTLLTSMASRRQPLILYLTTAGYDRNTICYETYQYACKVRDGVLDDPSFMPVIYEAPMDADWKSPEVWKIANPNLGVSVSEEYLLAACNRAVEMPTYENTFRRLHLNQWTEQDVRWIPMSKWDALKNYVSLDAFYDRDVYVGLDLSSTTDLTAMTLSTKLPGGKIGIYPFFWIPSESAHQREKRDKVPYITWNKQDHIFFTEGNVVDYEAIRAVLNSLQKKMNIQGVAIDRWNATHLITLLTEDGFNVVPFGQGFASMSGPSKEFETLILKETLRHSNNPVMNWCVSNVSIVKDPAENIKPSKELSTQRIDGVVASIMSIGLLCNKLESSDWGIV